MRDKVIAVIIILGIANLLIHVILMLKTRVSVRRNSSDFTSTARETERCSSVEDKRSSDEVTVVTAFFDIGPFLKLSVGKTRVMRDPKDYFKWSDIFGRMDNPLVAYTDNADFYQRLIDTRTRFASNRSKIYLVERSDFWAFSLVKTIQYIYNQTGYPQISPQTTSPNYTCLTHAKMELFQQVLNKKPFNTKLYSWVDVGVFREFLENKEVFHVGVPARFNSSRVHFNRVSHFDKTMEVSKLIRYCYFWIGAGIFMGEEQPLTLFMSDYMKMVRMLINRFMIGAEEQVFYAMYRNYLGFKPRVDVQLFDDRYNQSHNFWFALARHVRVSGYYNQSL